MIIGGAGPFEQHVHVGPLQFVLGSDFVGHASHCGWWLGLGCVAIKPLLFCPPLRVRL